MDQKEPTDMPVPATLGALLRWLYGTNDKESDAEKQNESEKL